MLKHFGLRIVSGARLRRMVAEHERTVRKPHIFHPDSRSLNVMAQVGPARVPNIRYFSRDEGIRCTVWRSGTVGNRVNLKSLCIFGNLGLTP